MEANNNMFTEKLHWYDEAGPENDIAISSRVRLSRNVMTYKYPGVMTAAHESESQQKIIDSISSLDETGFTTSLIESIQPVDRKILLEKNVISQAFSLKLKNAVFASNSGYISGVINDIDHLRIVSMQAGLDLETPWKALDSLDSKLENHLEWAVSLELGYLNTEINNTGTGLRASTMLHLPILTRTGLIDKAVKTIAQMDISVKGFFSEDEHSLGSLYQISNESTIGSDEQTIMEKVRTISLRLIDSERKARDEYYKKNKLEAEDQIYRSRALLEGCRLISMQEAGQHLSNIRLGVSLDLIDEVEYQVLNRLIFDIQKAHLQKKMKNNAENGNTGLIDHIRATIIKDALFNNAS